MPMNAARDLATDLGLEVGNAHLQTAFNGWLAKSIKFQILAATVA